jgi:hypothetical protein
MPPSPTRNRWWNRATKSILTSVITLGAVAGAISTVISLWPSPDSDDSAEVTVRIIPGIPLSEYQHRMESTGAISLRVYSPPEEEAIPEPTAPPEPSEATSPVPTASPDPIEASASTRPDPDPTADATSVLTAVPFADPTSAVTDGPYRPDQLSGTARRSNSNRSDSSNRSDIVIEPDVDAEGVQTIVEAYEDLTDSSIPSDFIAIGNAVSPSGEPVAPEVAAAQIAKVLADARHAPSAADPTASDPEPLGVVVSTDLDLSGLRGKALTLSWSMWQEAGGIRLSGDWLNDNLAYRIEPRTDHATTTLDVWIPMPREPGSYFVRVDLRNGPTRIDSGESERFE